MNELVSLQNTIDHVICNLPFGSVAKPESLAAEKYDASSFPPVAPSFSTPSWRGQSRVAGKLFSTLNSTKKIYYNVKMLT